MTLDETRQLGIEFERRVQTMIPEKEYLDKLDSDTIYAYLNSYQSKYIHEIYRNLDQIKSGSKLSAHMESVLQKMLRTQTITVTAAKNYTGNISDANGVIIIENGRSVTYPLDPSFYMYVRSVSNVQSTFSFKSNESGTGKQLPIRVVPNELVSQSDMWRLLETPNNSLRILRSPAATIGAYEEFNSPSKYFVTGLDGLQSDVMHTEDDIQTAINNIGNVRTIGGSLHDLLGTITEVGESLVIGVSGTTNSAAYSSSFTVALAQKGAVGKVPTLNVVYDQYTTPVGVKVVYYAQPQKFDVMTSKECELPIDAFDDLVTGAVDLYVQYVAGAEANKRHIQEAARQAQNNNKRRNNETED